MAYELLVNQYPHLVIKEVYSLPKGLAGLYMDNEILLDKNRSMYERHCILAEELGHYETTHGDILDLRSLRNKKMELAARRWGYEKIVPLDKLIECHRLNFISLEEVCVYLEITSKYLKISIDHYLSRYGLSTMHNGYEIFFDPLFVKRV